MIDQLLPARMAHFSALLSVSVRLLPLFFILAGIGCTATRKITDPILGPSHEVANVFRKEAKLPTTLRRVAILPVSFNEHDSGASAGQSMLEPVLHAELAKASRFEVAIVTPAQLQQWTGKAYWSDLDPLPPNLFKTLSEKTGSDAVLFSQLSHFKAYPPIMVGWRMKLVANDANTLWSVDELFDASEESVSNAARRYDRARVRNNPALEDSRSILLSPSRFGHYTANALLGTLPTR